MPAVCPFPPGGAARRFRLRDAGQTRVRLLLCRRDAAGGVEELDAVEFALAAGTPADADVFVRLVPAANARTVRVRAWCPQTGWGREAELPWPGGAAEDCQQEPLGAVVYQAIVAAGDKEPPPDREVYARRFIGLSAVPAGKGSPWGWSATRKLVHVVWESKTAR